MAAKRLYGVDNHSRRFVDHDDQIVFIEYLWLHRATIQQSALLGTLCGLMAQCWLETQIRPRNPSVTRSVEVHTPPGVALGTYWGTHDDAVGTYRLGTEYLTRLSVWFVANIHARGSSMDA